MSEENPEYKELLGVKDKRIDPSKNPNYRRFSGLANLIKVLKHDHDVIRNTPVESTKQLNHHVLLLIRERKLGAFKITINHYEEEIQSVKKKLETGNRFV